MNEVVDVQPCFFLISKSSASLIRRLSMFVSKLGLGWGKSLKYVVSTSRVVVPTGRYVVPVGKVIIIVSPGRLSLVPTGRVLSPGSKDLSRVGSNKWYQSLLRVSHKKNIPRSKILITSQPNTSLQPIKLVIQNGNNLKRIGRDRDRRVIILLPTTADEHIDVQRESKARTTLLQMQKILSQLNQLKAKPEDEDINLKFLRALPSSWSHVALTLKTKGPSHSAFVSTTSASKKMSYADFQTILHLPTLVHQYSTDRVFRSGKNRSGGDGFEMAMLSVRVHKFEQKARRKIDFDKKESDRFNKKKVRCYKCLQRGHFARECRAKGGNDKQRYSSFKIQEIGKKEEDSKALITVDTLVD
ncbi:ribonuclease H-like domain-containing protein [Tanacetum coccineum]